MTGRPPLVVAWEVTRACPLACAHCRAEAQRFAHPAQLTAAEGRRFVADLARAYPGAVLMLTGGEPLARADTLELAAYGTSLGLQLALSVDVGRLLTPGICRAIRDTGIRRVSFSLHFPDAARSDRFARSPGFHEEALAGLANLRAAGAVVQLRTSVMRSNAALLPRLHDLVVSLGASAWELSFLVPLRRGASLADEELAPSEQEDVLRWLYRLQRTSPVPVAQICTPPLKSIMRGCPAGNGFCFVSHIGEVRGCGYLPLSVGNVRDRPFGELYADSPLFRAFRDPSRRGGNCGVCEFRADCGGCRALAYAATGDPLAEEPDCAFAPRQAARGRRQFAASSSSRTD